MNAWQIMPSPRLTRAPVLARLSFPGRGGRNEGGCLNMRRSVTRATIRSTICLRPTPRTWARFSSRVAAMTCRAHGVPGGQGVVGSNPAIPTNPSSLGLGRMACSGATRRVIRAATGHESHPDQSLASLGLWPDGVFRRHAAHDARRDGARIPPSPTTFSAPCATGVLRILTRLVLHAVRCHRSDSQR